MRVLVAGAGAVGGFIAARLARAGNDVAALARRANRDAIQRNGIRVIGEAEEFFAHPRIAGDAESDPPQAILLCVKAHQLPAIAPSLAARIGPETVVVSVQNGIPWWSLQCNSPMPLEWQPDRIDPGGSIAAHIPAASVVGAIVYFSTVMERPGVIRHIEGNRMSIGEPGGGSSERCLRLAEVLRRAGLRCSVSRQIRSEVWMKLMGNVAFNPISALTRCTLGEIVNDPDMRLVAQSVMREVETVALRLGIRPAISVERRMDGAARHAAHRTSMLQDLEAGRDLEIEAVLGAVVELGERLGIPMFHSRTLYACTKLLCRSEMAKRYMGASQ